MAQNTHTLQFVCRSCRQQINKIPSSRRSFSNTTQKNKSIPQFQPTAQPELDDLLLSYRQKVFTPAALSVHHQRLMFRPSRSAILKQDLGVKVTMSDGEQVKLEPRSRWERPRNGPSFMKISSILSSTDDPKAWWNLIPFLEGLVLAREPARKHFLEKVARKAGEQGMEAVIIRAAEMHDRTGITLALPGLTRAVMLGLHDSAVAFDWQGSEFEQVAKRADRVALLLEEENHCGGSKQHFAEKGLVDMRRSLTVVSVLLEMSAAKTLNANNGKDVNGTVIDFVKRVIALCKEGIVDGVGKSEAKEKKEAWDAAIEAENLVPLVNGMQLALKIESIANSAQGKAVREQLALAKKELKKRLDVVKAQAGDKERRCIKMHEAIQN